MWSPQVDLTKSVSIVESKDTSQQIVSSQKQRKSALTVEDLDIMQRNVNSQRNQTMVHQGKISKQKQQFKLKSAGRMKAHIRAIIETNYSDVESKEYQEFLKEMDKGDF